jgi:zinc protease
MKKILFIVFLSFSSLGLFAQGLNIEFTKYKLDNGLDVILHQDNSTPIILVSIMYHVGSKNENPERTGFAHFFEHLMFEGTKYIDRGQYFKMIQGAGGTLNANTSFDRTYYYQILPSNQLELGLWMESERLMHAKVDSIGIATQKGVVTEEMKQTRDNQPYGTILTETLKRAFTLHPYRWDVLGADPHIRNSKDQDFVDFYNTFYVPNNAVLIVAGDFQQEDAKKLVQTYFGEIPAGKMEIPRPEANEPIRTQEVRDTVFDNIQLPLILHAYHTPAMGTKDFYAVEMLGTLLSRGQSSRLYRTLVDEQKVALQVGAFPFPLEHPGLALVFALPNLGIEPDALEAKLIEEIDKVRKDLISEEELQKLKNQFENQMINQVTTLEGRANRLADYHTFFGDASLINTDLENYLAVTREDIKRVANEYFRDDNRVVLYYLPKEE